MKTQQNQKIILCIALASLDMVFFSQAQPLNVIGQVEIPAGFSQVQSALTSPGSTTVYDSIAAGPLAGYSEPNANNPIFGDALNLSQGGQLSTFVWSIYNSSSGGNTGPILGGTFTLNFYDNTTPYAGGALNSLPLLASVNVSATFGTGLAVGFYSTLASDLTSLNINLPQNIFVTQKFAETSGTSLRNGLVLFNNSAIGSSPNNVYINSSATPEGLYSFSGGAANSQFGYTVEVVTVPEPTTMALAGLSGLAALVVARRRK